MITARRLSFVVPGIESIHVSCASSQANAICTGVACSCAPIRASRSTTGLFALRASGAKRVLVEQVDRLDAQPLQRAFGRLPDAFGAAVEPVRTARAARTKVVAKLGGDDDVLPERLQRLAYEFLVGERAVDLGGVEEGDAALYHRPNERDHLPTVRSRATVVVQAHAAQADGRDRKAVFAELARLHSQSPVWL